MAKGIEVIRCDLLDPEAVAQLPKLRNIVYMAGKKFGTNDDPSFAWAMNTYVPAIVAREFRESRLVVFSTLCVYPFAPIVQHGWDESVEPGPLGDYANSCVGRERMFEYFSALHGTPGRLFRLNYAIDMRYGVLHDVGRFDGSEKARLLQAHSDLVEAGLGCTLDRRPRLVLEDETVAAARATVSAMLDANGLAFDSSAAK